MLLQLHLQKINKKKERKATPRRREYQRLHYCVKCEQTAGRKTCKR